MDQNPTARTALMINGLHLLSVLALLSLQAGVGPRAVLYYFMQVAGPLLFGLIIIGSGLALFAISRSKGRDWRIVASFASLLLSLIGIVVFMTRT